MASRRGNRVIETSPERTKVWTEPPSKIRSSNGNGGRVPVIYYLSRNGQLEHPHFMEVPLSNNSVALHLKDVINRLNFLRGNGMASMYSWSCKRSYKNGYVWHDLTENDLIYPAQGREYILKGSEIVEGAFTEKFDETLRSASFSKPPGESNSKDTDGELSTVAIPRRRHQSWSSVDFHEYGVYTGETSGHISADASTQTDDKRRRRRPVGEIEVIGEAAEEEEEVKSKETENSTEISTDEISPPPSDASPETLEKLIKADTKIILRPGRIHDGPSMNMNGRSRASTVLMQLLTCGSIGFNKGNGNGIFVGSHKKVPRGRESGRGGKEEDDWVSSSMCSGFSGRLKPQREVEEKEYYSGSIIIETKKERFPALKRSSSYTADRSSKMEMTTKERGGGKEKPNCSAQKKETNTDTPAAYDSSSRNLTSSNKTGAM